MGRFQVGTGLAYNLIYKQEKRPVRKARPSVKGNNRRREGMVSDAGSGSCRQDRRLHKCYNRNARIKSQEKRISFLTVVKMSHLAPSRRQDSGITQLKKRRGQARHRLEL